MTYSQAEADEVPSHFIPSPPGSFRSGPPGAARDAAADTGSSCAERLRAAGLRATPPRLHVLRALVSDPGHWMAPEEIYRTLLEREVSATIASVYSALRAMESRGLVLREFHNGASGAKAAYLAAPGVAGDARPGVFVVCRQCNASRHADDAAFRHRLEAAARRLGLAAAGHHLTLHVTCERCAR